MPKNARTGTAQAYILFYWVLFLMLTLVLTYSWRQPIYYRLSITKFFWVHIQTKNPNVLLHGFSKLICE